MSAAVVFLLFLACLVLAVPISLSLGVVSVLPGMFDPSFTASAGYVIRSMFGGIDSFPLLAVPMFILSGLIMARGGISKKLFNLFAFFIGKLPAGLPCATVITCLFYGAISGSGIATVAAVGSMTIPILVGLGYDKKFCTALVAVAGALGVIIPPSIPFIIFGMASGASVSDIFLAGIVPGILIAVLLMVYAVFYCVKNGEDKEKIGEMVGDLHARGFIKVFIDSFWALLSPVIILGCIYSGIASPTEAAVISVFYSLVVSLVIYKTIKVNEVYAILAEAVKTYAPILFILAASTAFSRVLTLMQVPQTISGWILATFSSKVVILLVVNVFLLLVGMVMDTTPAILILTPILMPIMNGIGIAPIHFGIFMCVNLAIGFVTPPIGVNLFVASSLTDIPVMKIAKHALPLIVMNLIALMFITFIPQISLCLLG
ncbi:MAG: TRAP transporter large permease [Lachnospiraceae bacterium]|nr:TRAP transporter large permease [Lachnospiraceae bacterium]